ncbi:MAG: TolC family protein [Polyangiaceae bacterium]
MRTRFTVTVPALALALGVTTPAFAQAPSKPATSAPAAAAELPLPEVTDPMLAAVPPPKNVISTWEEALVHVRARSVDLRNAYNEVRRAEGQWRSALAATLPTLTAQGAFNYNLITKDVTGFDSATLSTKTVQTPQTNVFSGTIALSQPLLAVATWHAIKTASLNEDVTRMAAEDVKRNIALGVSNALVAAVTAERVAELNRVGLRNALQRAELTERRRGLGAATALDVVRAQQDVTAARATLVTGDESLRQAREALGIALGYPEPYGVTRDLNLNALEESARKACHPETAVESRADLQAAAGREKVAKRNVDNVYLQFIPTVDLRSNVTTTSQEQLFGPRTTWAIQGVLTVPLWEGGARYGALRQNRAVADTAASNLEGLKRTATIQVTQARRGVEVAMQTAKVAADARDQAAELDRLTRASYQEGRGTSLELVVAASALRQAEINFALREFDVVKAKVLALLALSSCPW